jgi:hypothetical protein
MRAATRNVSTTRRRVCVRRMHKAMRLTPELTDRAKRHVAQLAANGSSLRNQGAPGVVEAARGFLEALDLRRFVTVGPAGFAHLLDTATAGLCASFPKRARNWGAARKVLNLFLRDCLYNTYLEKAYGLLRLRPLLEVPLDRQVADGLRDNNVEKALPRWPGLKRVTQAQNSEYQRAAAAKAKSLGVARVDVDLWYWRPRPK